MRLGGLHAFDDQVGRRLRQRREDATAVKPADTFAEDRGPVEVAGLQPRGGLIRPVVEDDRAAHAKSAVAVDGGHIWAQDAVMRKRLVERSDPHRAHLARDEVADGILDHRGRNRGPHTEAVGKIRGAVEFPSAHVDRARARFPKRHGARIQPVNQGPKRQHVYRA